MVLMKNHDVQEFFFKETDMTVAKIYLEFTRFKFAGIHTSSPLKMIALPLSFIIDTNHINGNVNDTL